MKKSMLILFLSVFLMTFVSFGIISLASAAGKSTRWKVSTCWPAGMQLLKMDKHCLKLINDLAGDELEIKFFEGGSLIPPFQILDAVQKGTIDAGFVAIEYWVGKDSAFEALSSYPMQFEGIDGMIWAYQAGGVELAQEVFSKFGIVGLPYIFSPPESGFRGNKPIRSLADFKGLKIRIPSRTKGMVMKDLGAVQIQVSGGEVYQALEKGVIDAAEFAAPSIDWSLNLQEVTKCWATPGWHQPGVMYWLLINKSSWKKLPARLQAVVKTAAMANSAWSYAYISKESAEATKKFIDIGTEITHFSEQDLKTFQVMTNKHTLESSKENPLFAKIIYSQYKFLKDMSQWRHLQEPFSCGIIPVEFPDLDAIKACIK